MEILSKIIFSAAIVFSMVSLLDFVIYAIRSAPKSTVFSVGFLSIGFVSLIFVIYQLLP